MYPPHQKPTVRPRSSLSEINYTENQHSQDGSHKSQNQTAISFACLSLFLATLCVLLLGTLVITGNNNIHLFSFQILQFFIEYL